VRSLWRVERRQSDEWQHFNGPTRGNHELFARVHRNGRQQLGVGHGDRYRIEFSVSHPKKRSTYSVTGPAVHGHCPRWRNGQLACGWSAGRQCHRRYDQRKRPLHARKHRRDSYYCCDERQ
jgi:hypothetical protein